MNKLLMAVAAVGAGIGAMYLLDPDRGRRRRARVGQLATRLANRTGTIAATAGRDMGDRARGVVARAWARSKTTTAPSDDVLIERVRARLGRLVAHPHAIQVSAHDGHVRLVGPVFRTEVEQLLDGVSAVSGVLTVDNQVDAYDDATHVSALQGAGPRTVPSVADRWRRSTPAARVLAGAAGVALLAVSSRNRRLRGAGSAAIGVELLEWALIGASRTA